MLTPGYHAVASLAASLQTVAVAWDSPLPEVVVLATRDDATRTLGIAVIDRRLERTPVDLSIALPPGHWHGTQTIQAAAGLTDAEISRDSTDIDATGHLTFTLPANGLAVFHLIAM
jgi:hypothetical protein